MNNFVDGINDIIDKRQFDIAIAKRSILLARSESQQIYLLKACVLSIYSSLEGGIKELSSYLLGYINRTSVMVSDLDRSYLQLAIGETCKLEVSINDHEKKIKTASLIRDCLQAKAQLPGSVETDNNIKPKVLAKICRSLGIDYFLDINQEKDLNILLRFRNNIAHGDREMSITLDRVDQFSEIVQFVLTQFSESVINAYNNKNWIT